MENITQNTVRDRLFDTMIRLEAAGHSIVFDVHDEVVIEALESTADLDKVVELMSRPIH